MAPPLKDKKIGTLILIALVGIIIGAYLDAVLGKVLPDGVVKTFFTYPISFGIGDFGSGAVATSVGDASPERLNPLVINLYAVKFQLGFQFRFSLLSVLGIFMSLYFFRWYK